VLFSIRQQVQPAFSIVPMQSQQDWIMSQHLASPLTQVTQTPLAIISHLHMPIIRLQLHTTRPFIIMQQEHIPPASMVQRFCIMPQLIVSSQVQVIFMPPWHFSNFIVQRGTIIQLAAGIVPGAPIVGMPMPVLAIPCVPTIPARSIITPFIMVRLL
jgi:hypothetical protein